MEINAVMKELFKHIRTCEPLSDKGVVIFTVDEAMKLIQRIQGVYTFIEKTTTEAIVDSQKKGMDDEDYEQLLEEVQAVNKGKHYVMQVSGNLLGNMGKSHPEVSAKVGDVLLPPYATTLLGLEEKQEYEITDAVCMIDDCLERGDQSLFDKIVGQGVGNKLFEVIKYAASDKNDLKYDILYSAIFGMGVIAQREKCGMFGQLTETLAMLEMSC
jgi:hypothetical protein